MINDPVGDMLTRIRNAQMRRRGTVSTPGSKLRARVLEVLKSEGYIRDYAVTKADVGSKLTIVLKYGPNRERTISGVRRISKPGLRVYAKKENLPRVLGGLGIAIISTSSGLLTDRAAHKAGIGGEVVAYVW